jgi:hypothetical protein
MKWIMYLGTALLLSGCAFKGRQLEQAGPSPTATAQVGIVNHTGKYIYSASVDGAGGETGRHALMSLVKGEAPAKLAPMDISR